MLVFLHIPKTGGTSFRFILENNFGLRHCHSTHASEEHFTEGDFGFARRIFWRLRSVAGHNLADPVRLPFRKAFFVTMLRDPIARVVSHFPQLKRRRNPNIDVEKAFREWGELENLHVKLMAGGRNLDKAKFFLEKQCGFVGITEKFDLSLRVFNHLSPLKLEVNYRKQRVSKDAATKKGLLADARFLELAREYNRLDIELYSFAMNEIFPRLCEKAGRRVTDNVPALDTWKDEFKLKYSVGRFFNRVVYRELCKVRNRLIGRKNGPCGAESGEAVPFEDSFDGPVSESEF